MGIETKIIALIHGGLGNQLFSYAAARRLALVNDAELVLDHVSGFRRDFRYGRQYQLDHFNISARKAKTIERLEPFERIRRYIKRKVNRYVPFDQRNYIRQEGIDFDNRLLEFKPRGMVFLEGYWQSEGYFKDVEATIRKDLLLTPPKDSTNQQMAAKVSHHKSVAVHVRFFDAPQHATEKNNAPVDYYRKAVEEMEKKLPNAHYFIFSDQPTRARERIPLADNRITLVSYNEGDENAYADLWLMMQCKHFIIANSTFSWWGAWLSNHKRKIVISPGEIRGDVTAWGFPGLIPDSWITING